jgi:GrpB-like predicted nucleotidyltransferase (UPF0157 family)
MVRNAFTADPASQRWSARFRTLDSTSPVERAESARCTRVPDLDVLQPYLEGVLDLAAEVAPDDMRGVTDALVAGGWQRQAGAHAFPSTRPMLVAGVEHEGQSFRAHFHLLPAGSGELAELRAFRDALAMDADLRARYVARKREVLERGVSHGPDYAEAKADVIRDALVAAGLRESGA